MEGIIIIKEFLKIEMIGQHVKGHQDMSISKLNIDIWGKMNIWCDGRAKETLYSEMKVSVLPITGWQIWIDGILSGISWEVGMVIVQ